MKTYKFEDHRVLAVPTPLGGWSVLIIEEGTGYWVRPAEIVGWEGPKDADLAVRDDVALETLLGLMKARDARLKA